MNNAILDVINRRRSSREFLPDQLKKSEWQTLLQAGMCAPFAQAGSRHFTFIQNQDMILRLNKSAKDTAIAMEIPGLSQLAQNPDFHCTYRAPSLILLSGKSDTISPEADCAAAAENILIAAEALDFGACWIYFTVLAFLSPEADVLRADLKIPKEYRPLASIALGYRKRSAQEPPQNSQPVTIVL